MSSTQRIDDIINGITPAEPQEVQEIAHESPEVEGLSSSENESDSGETKENNESEGKEAAKDISSKSESIAPDESKEIKETDEYGIEVPKARTYTEEEVQRMIRDRLSRGQHAQPHQQPQQQQGADFQLDPNSDQPWEMQLESFVKGTIDKVNRETQTKQWQAQEQERQTNFEVKFSTGMEKFPDFKDIVGQLPISDAIMMSIRDMENPATFLYAAAKLRPDEVKRIAALSDPFQQAKEIGRLDEQMRKAKNVSKAAPPLKPITSDVSAVRPAAKKGIDSLIQSHAKSKLRPTK